MLEALASIKRSRSRVSDTQDDPQEAGAEEALAVSPSAAAVGAPKPRGPRAPVQPAAARSAKHQTSAEVGEEEGAGGRSVPSYMRGTGRQKMWSVWRNVDKLLQGKQVSTGFGVQGLPGVSRQCTAAPLQAYEEATIVTG